MAASPDMMVSLFNEQNIYRLIDPQFDTFTVTAVAADLDYHPLPEILALSAALKAKKTVYRLRGWQQQLKDDRAFLFNPAFILIHLLKHFRRNI